MNILLQQLFFLRMILFFQYQIQFANSALDVDGTSILHFSSSSTLTDTRT
jgi:hypothetical protein